MKNVRKFRESRGWTAAELAERAGTSQPTITRMERGNTSVSLNMILAVAKALGVPAWMLLVDDQEEAITIINQAYLVSPPEVQEYWLDMADAALRRSQVSDG